MLLHVHAYNYNREAPSPGMASATKLVATTGTCPARHTKPLQCYQHHGHIEHCYYSTPSRSPTARQ